MTRTLDEKIMLEEQRKANTDLFDTIKNHKVLKKMLITWLVLPVIFTIGVILFYILNATGALTAAGHTIQVDVTILQGINSDMFVATITIIGIILGIVPLLSFFWIGELKDIEQAIHEDIHERKLRKTKEMKEELDVEEGLRKILYAKLRKTVKMYTQFAVFASAVALLVTLAFYFFIGIQNSIIENGVVNPSVANNIAFNILVDVLVLMYVVTELAPLVSLALFELGYKAVPVSNLADGKEYTVLISE